MDPVLLILAGITAFIIFRLISVMGTRTGHEQSHDLEAMQRAQEKSYAPETDETEENFPPAPRKPVSAAAQPLREADETFDEPEFLAGARAAYEQIVEAFAGGDLRSIRPWLSEPVYRAFKTAVADRETLGHTNDLKFVGIDDARITDSESEDGALKATVAFKSNQVRVTRDRNGDVVDGDANRIDLVADHWVFMRDLSNRDPNWTLIATNAGE